jgi:hypothetical protein
MEWRFDAGREVYFSPSIDVDGTVYFGNMAYSLFAVAPSGAQKWRLDSGGSDGGMVIGYDGSIYTVSYATLYCHDQNGVLRWSYEFKGGPGVIPITPTIAKDGQVIYVARDSLYAINRNGTLRWQMKPLQSIDLGLFPAVSPDGVTVYARARNGIYAIDTSGALKWSYAGSYPSNPAIDNSGTIYFSIGSTTLVALYPSGTLKWMAAGLFIPSGGELCPAIGWDGTVYLPGEELYAFDQAGKLKWHHSTGGGASVPAIDSAGTIYIGRCTRRTAADSCNLLALNARDGAVMFQLSLKNPDGVVPDIDSSPAITSDGRLFVGCDRPHGQYLFKVF